MNEYQRFIQDELDRRNWRPADIEKHGGPSRQVVSSILNDKRQVLVQRPKQETIEGIATAFSVPVDTVLAHVAIAMGFPVSITEASLDDVADADLLEQIRKRMNRESSDHEQPEQQTSPPNLRPVGEDSDAEDLSAQQKIPADLAAHPEFELEQDRFEWSLGDDGEGSQVPPGED